MDEDVTLLPVNLARLARELAMDIIPAHEIQGINQIDDGTWQRIQSDPNFQAMLADMVLEWNAAANVKARVRVKAATGVESVLETLLQDIQDQTIPLNQRVEATKLIAKLGELIDRPQDLGATGEKVTIQIFTDAAKPPMIIDATPLETPDG